MLRQDSVRFNTNQTYRVSITVNGSSITVLVDGVQFYSGSDTSHTRGSVAMYTYRNSGATFDNVIVRGIVPTANRIDSDRALHAPDSLLARSKVEPASDEPTLDQTMVVDTPIGRAFAVTGAQT